MSEDTQRDLESDSADEKIVDEQFRSDLQQTMAELEQEKQNFLKKKTGLEQEVKERNSVLQELEIRKNRLESTKKVYENFIITDLCPRSAEAVLKLSRAAFIVPIQENKMLHAVKRYTKPPASKVEKPLKKRVDDKLADLKEERFRMLGKIEKNEDHMENLSNILY